MKPVLTIAAAMLLAVPVNANPLKSALKAVVKLPHVASSAVKASIDLGKAEATFGEAALLSQAELVLLAIHDFNSRKDR